MGCPYTTIQAGIDAAAVGDTILVLPGVYLERIVMKNGVDVVSQGGPAVTTLDATGQAFSAVRFSNTVPGSTLVSTLSGLTITGGTGRPRSAADRGASNGAVAGGGIFIYNRNQNIVAPIVQGNVITGNVLQTPSANNYPELLGGGIYVAVGRPLIADNLITDNTAVRTQGPSHFGDGAGLYATYFGLPIVSGNTFSGNHAGDGGGGLSLYGGPPYAEKPEIDGNLIVGNIADQVAGGIAVGSYAEFVVTNNVIRGNSAALAGGAFYTFYGSAAIRNNTIVGNSAVSTGGIWVGKSDPGNLVEVTNNVVTQNTSTDGIFAAGIRALTGASAQGAITFTFNDLVGNTPSDFGGIPDPALSPGNITLPPLFADAPGGNYRLQPGSPGLDVGSNAAAPPLDFDGEPRPLDGTGDNVAVADLGAFELLIDSDADGIPDDGSRSGVSGDLPCAAGGTAGCDDNCRTTSNALQEDADADGRGNVCDVCPADPLNDADADGVCGAIDNCPAVANPGQANQDGDALGDACDPDIDNDLVLNASDCAPFVNSADAIPGAVAGPAASDGAGTLVWIEERQSNVYNIYRASRPSGQAFTYNFACIAPELPATSLLDAASPAERGTFFYLVAGVNACGEGPLGASSSSVPIVAALPCAPLGADGDGDTVIDRDDNCPLVANLAQVDADLDGAGDACDLDADGDGTPNGTDCAPLDPSASIPVSGIGASLTLGAGGTTLSWTADPAATSYHLFRGAVAAGAPFAYSYGCVQVVTGAASASDPTLPPLLGRLYYVVAAVNACGGSGAGTNSQGAARPAPTPCP